MKQRQTPNEADRELYRHVVGECQASAARTAAATAAVVLVENQLQEDMSDADHEKWLAMALRISNYMSTQADEPRFTLYDYLDACVNTATLDWHDAADRLADIDDEAFEWLADLAQAKRDTYSS